MNIQEMKEKKKEMGYTNEQIAELSGVPLGTVQKIFGGATTSPRGSSFTSDHTITNHGCTCDEYYKLKYFFALQDFVTPFVGCIC